MTIGIRLFAIACAAVLACCANAVSPTPMVDAAASAEAGEAAAPCFEHLLADGQVWQQCEEHNCGTWTFEPRRGRFDARWQNGAVGVIGFTGERNGCEYTFGRLDEEGASPGLSAEYRGIFHESHIDGTVTWRSADGRVTHGMWSATY